VGAPRRVIELVDVVNGKITKKRSFYRTPRFSGTSLSNARRHSRERPDRPDHPERLFAHVAQAQRYEQPSSTRFNRGSRDHRRHSSLTLPGGSAVKVPRALPG
jgi:hypothetical protein